MNNDTRHGVIAVDNSNSNSNSNRQFKLNVIVIVLVIYNFKFKVIVMSPIYNTSQFSIKKFTKLI